MIPIFLIIVGLFLVVFSIIDLKTHAIPSIFLTAGLFMVAVLNPANLWFGIMGFIMAYLLFEADFFSGIADIKIMAMLSFLVCTTNWFFLMILLTVVYGFVWKALIKWRFKKEKECAFIPVFLIIFLTLAMMGGLQ